MDPNTPATRAQIALDVQAALRGLGTPDHGHLG